MGDFAPPRAAFSLQPVAEKFEGSIGPSPLSLTPTLPKSFIGPLSPFVFYMDLPNPNDTAQCFVYVFTLGIPLGSNSSLSSFQVCFCVLNVFVFSLSFCELDAPSHLLPSLHCQTGREKVRLVAVFLVF